MTDVRAALDAVILPFDLNTHPFYRAWRDGTLPRARLELYAAEYARFIDTLEEGWRSVGHDAHADEERAHAGLWRDFREALDAKAGAPVAEVTRLVDEVRALFADRPAATGALYAFEAQQPATAASKLEGLRAHYALGDRAEAYFAVHAADYGERDLLASSAEALDESGRARALDACARTSRAMWKALDGILAA